MINLIGKSLVMLHTMLCIMGMAWAIMLVLQVRDVGWEKPYTEVTEYTAENAPKKGILYASEIDKSFAALTDAKNTRDRTYVQVKPAIESVRATEPHLARNALFYRSELNRLQKSKNPIEVKRLLRGGILDFESELGKPKTEAVPVKSVAKSFTAYQADLKKVFDDIDAVELEIRGITKETKEYAFQLTGTDDADQYVQPGLYQLYEQEFKSQGKIKDEIDDIKPFWSQAIEQANVLQFRYNDLRLQADKLRAGLPPGLKDKKK